MTWRERVEWSGLVEFLRTSVEQMVHDKLVLQTRKANIDPADVSAIMVDVFYESIDTEREKVLQQTIDQLIKVQLERDSLENEYARLEATHNEESLITAHQNADLKAQVESLESELKALEWQRVRRENSYQETLASKKRELAKLSRFVGTFQDAQRALCRQVTSLKSDAVKMKRSQLSYLRRSRGLIANRVNELIQQDAANQERDQARKVSRVSTRLGEVEEEQKSLKRQCRTVLKSLADADGQHSKLTSISVDELPKRLADIREYVAESIEERKEVALRRFKQQVIEEFPGIQIGEGNVAAAVSNHIRDRLRAKEIECERILKKGEARERKLQEQLDRALQKIKKLQDPGGDYRYLDEFERSKSAWEEQQRRTDARMAKIGSMLATDE
jgi:hypothetical protein